ncbi:alpha-amylase family protein [Kineosporia mesophila]|uniref:Alpha-amylase family protein n=1 Tax=Kineosporia mesophila TaxID=566012 RepID=A0ABP7ALT6_9ACTN|nr:alpha-amylase family protein [Kineosporia mesophila]MCD5354538.1 alpha-amylase family protein [Kineosporia mesophila]
MPGWVDNVIWWHVYPIGFLGADARGAERAPVRTLRDLTVWLDYLVELGANGLALGPVFRSSTHGYDTLDYLSIDERLGDRADFDTLVAECRRRGVRVLLDGVFNHVGPDFPRLQAARAGDADAARWFVRDEKTGELGTFEGHSGLIALNHAEPQVVIFVAAVMNHWLDAGADGWRLDAAYTVPRSFWGQVLPAVRERHPEAYIVGEVIHGDYPGIVRESGMDSLTQYELWKAIWSSVNDRNLFELSWALKRHCEMLQTFVPMTFTGNHDVTRIASRIDDERHLPHTIVLLLTLPGTPSVYYGDEQGFRGVKEDRAGGDDAVRPPFPAEGPSDLAPFGWDLYRLHQLLIGFRRRNAWLRRAEVEVRRLTNHFLSYECRSGAEHLVVAVNLGDSPESVELPPGEYSVFDSTADRSDRISARLTVPAHRWAIAHR